MKEKDPNFFKRLKDAVLNFDEYKKFADEKISISIKYLAKFMLLFSIIITIAFTIKIVSVVNDLKENIAENCPEFRIEENTLIIESENNKLITGIEGQIGLIVDSKIENLDDTPEVNDYTRFIAFLKDKVIIKDNNGIQNSITYQELKENNSIAEDISKQKVMDFLSSNKMIIIYATFAGVMLIAMFIVYTIQVIIDVFLLSLIGFLLSRIVGVRLKYSKIFSISIYSITLSLLLYAIYIIVNLFTGFNIIYFDIAYRAISYIYIVTALLIIKSDLIKQNMELTKIIQVQKQVREEKDNEEEEEQEQDKKEDSDEKEKKDNKEENNNVEEPQGNQA